MVKVSRSIIPSFFTIINMFFGFYSVIVASQGKYELAVWLIFIAAIMDALDGKVARFAKASSEFGVEYDSLADVVSFGFAPSYLIYVTYFHQWGNIGLFVSFAPLLFGSLRLARFNIQLEGFDKTHFIGLPIPAAAVTISSYLLFEKKLLGGIPHFKFYLFVVLLTSFLMISNIRYETFPKLKFDGTKIQFFRIMFIYIGLFLLFLFPTKALFLLSATYITLGMLGAARRNVSILQKKESKKRNNTQHNKKNRRNDESNRKGEAEKRDS